MARSVPVPSSRRFSRKSSLALCGKPVSSGSPTPTAAPRMPPAALAACLRHALILEGVVLADVEVDVDRVLHDDGGEDRRSSVRSAAADEIAGRHQRAAHAARDRRRDAAEAELELGGLHTCLGNLHQGLRVAHEVLAIVECLLARCSRVAAAGARVNVELRVADADLRLIELRLGLIERALERARIDGEQQVALLHVLAVGELHLGEVAGDARAHLDRFDRAKRPVYSSHSITLCVTGWLTVSSGGAAGFFALSPPPLRRAKADLMELPTSSNPTSTLRPRNGPTAATAAAAAATRIRTT